MFKWGRNKKSSSYEPKTPKIPNISLPDERHIPSHIYQSYSEKPHTHHKSYSRDYIPNKRATTPLVQPTYHREVPSGRSRPRTMSSPVREVEAPRPIRPHPSQGPFLPSLDPRTHPSHVALAPVGGEFFSFFFQPSSEFDPCPVPSAAFLEEQLRRQASESRTVPPPNMIDVSDYVYPEETKLREVAKRTGATVTTQLSKAYLESLEEQNRENDRLKRAPSKRSSSKFRDSKGSEKEYIDFDNYKPVPVEAIKPVKKEPGFEPPGPLKSALKKPTPPKPKPALKSALKKSDNGHNNAYASEPELPRPTQDRVTSRPKAEPVFVPSKAYLEDQQEKLDEAAKKAARHRNSTPARPTVHEIRPSAFTHTHSSSTGSSPSEYHGNTSHSYVPRPSRGNYFDATVPSSNYVTPYIRGPDNRWTRATTNPTPMHHPPPRPLVHVPLNWPLIDYAIRRGEGYPRVYYDTAFDPRHENYPIKLRRGLDSWEMSEDDKRIPAGLGMPTHEMWIVHKSLPRWPIHLKEAYIRVIDVFMWIHDEYAKPLTAQELMEIGPVLLEQCRPHFEKRCREGPSWQHVEEKKGILRIDMLKGRRMFKGLQPVPGKPGTYELLLD